MKSKTKHFLKAVTYRLIATMTTFGLAYLFLDGNVGLASGFAIMESILKAAIYYQHERIWHKITKP